MRVSDMNIDRIYVNQLMRKANYQIIENHFHYYYEFFYVRQGKCRFFINNSLYDLNAGEFLIIPPREVHFNRYLAQTVRTNIYFRGSDLLENGSLFLPNLEKRFLQMQVIHVPSTYQHLINQLIDSMLQEENIDDETTGPMLQLLLKQIFLSCNRYCTFRSDDIAFSADGAEDILQAAQYITDHYSQPITLEQLAEMVNLSPSYFSKKFHQTLGMGMKEYLNYERLKHASLELLSTQHSITEIAINCGFSDGNYFKDAFKKIYDVSPRAYRKARAEEYTLEQTILND
nr:AraC family transcriptional regulator [Lachnospiraceae bacterium]